MAEPTSKERHVRPLAAIVCDEIRQEISGKQIIIGMYTGDVITDNLPASLPLTFLFIVEVIRKGIAEMEIEFVGPASGLTRKVDVEIDFREVSPPHQPAYMPMPRLMFNAKEPGRITVRLREKGDEWQLMRVVEITQRSTSERPTSEQ